MTLTISDVYGFGDGNLSAGRYRVALFGTIEAVPDANVADCKQAYLAGEHCSHLRDCELRRR